MKKYLSEYIKYIDDIIKNGQVTKEILDTHLIKITFFQHERLIHLLVTLFYALFTLAFLALGTIHYIFFIIFLILIIFLIFYIFHYFFLENSVQYLYKQYDILPFLFFDDWQGYLQMSQIHHRKPVHLWSQ